MKYLFMGGPADGQWRDVEGEAPFVQVNMPVAAFANAYSFDPSFDPARAPSTVEFRRAMYYRREWCSGTSREFIYCEESILPKEQLKLLIGNYKP